MTFTVDDILAAMRADEIPPGTSGLWAVERLAVSPRLSKDAHRVHGGRVVPPGSYTWLRRHTDATQHLAHGEVVMCDVDHELRMHLDFILRARGEILISGLGLGCVVRGLLTMPSIGRIDIVERDEHVLRLVAKHLPDDDRIHIHWMDALEFARMTPGRWNYAWHDLWTDRGAGEPTLQVRHAELLAELVDKVDHQDAWAFPRHHRRAFRVAGVD